MKILISSHIEQENIAKTTHIKQNRQIGHYLKRIINNKNIFYFERLPFFHQPWTERQYNI